MKVALIQFQFPYYTVELANGLANFADVTLIQPDKWSENRGLLDPRIKVLQFNKRYRIRDPRNICAMRELLHLIRQVQPDVIHTQETNELWYDLMLLFHRLPPFVTTVHDVFSHPGDRDLPFGAAYTRRISYYRSQQLIVHTHLLRQVLLSKFKRPARQVAVVAHGELGSFYQRSAQLLDSEIQLTQREPYTLLFFGRIWSYKGLKYLIKAMPIVAQQIPQVKLIIAGRGEPLDWYFPKGYDPQRYEIMDGFIPQEAVAALFQRSAAVVLPYIEASQSGVAAIAYGTGTPVIASDIGGLGEMIQHGKDGFLVPPGDVPALAEAIVRLLSNPALQQTMQQQVTLRAATDLNWKTIAAATMQVYHRAIERRSS